MSSSLNRIKKNIIEAMQSANNQGTSAYDSVAEVRRVEGDTAWVHIAGGVDETPVKLTIAAKVGDVVQVRVGGGRAWITGNASAPPTDDKTAIVAKSLANIAGNRAKVAQKVADQAQIVADSALNGTKENAAQMAQMVLDFNGDIENLQDQIDGNITTWFYDVDPATDLPPVTDWDTDEKKNAHLGDIYYNTMKGYAWRFMKSGSTYSWERITDTDVTKALADAAKAQDTANSKRRVFYNTPTVPYDAGDLWVQGSGGDILRCAQAKTSTGSYDRNDWVLASKYTDDTTAEQAKEDAANAQVSADNAQTGVDSLNDSVFGVQTFEYILDGVTIPVHKREDGTYYYILNDEEVTVAESDLVHDADGDLVSHQEGGIYEDLDVITGDIDAIDTKVNGFDAREDAIYKAISDNSLIARKNARVEENSIIITNDTTTDELLNYLQLNADSIMLYGEGDSIVTIAKDESNAGYMEMAGTSLLIAQESRLSTIRLRSAEKIGKLALVAGSDGHVSLREVLD